MATVDLGAIRFNWKGAYAGATAYVVDDVVSSGGGSYICILASTGNATSNATYWSVMAQAGAGSVAEDSSPQLTANLDVQTYGITSSSTIMNSSLTSTGKALVFGF